MCGFYLLLAGAVGKRQGIAIPYPSPTPLLTPMGIRCGGAYLLPRAWSNVGSCVQVLSLLPTSTWCLGALCSALYRSRFSRFRWAYFFRFSLLVGKKTLFVWLCRTFFGLPLTATIVPISFSARPFHQIGWVEPYCKKAFVRFRLLMICFSIPLSAKTIDPTAVSANPTKEHSQNPT